MDKLEDQEGVHIHGSAHVTKEDDVVLLGLLFLKIEKDQFPSKLHVLAQDPSQRDILAVDGIPKSPP